MQGRNASVKPPHPSSDSVDNISTSALQALAGIGDHDGHVRVLVEDLLDAAAVPSPFAPRGLIIRRSSVAVAVVGNSAVAERWLVILAARRRGMGSLEGSVWRARLALRRMGYMSCASSRPDGSKQEPDLSLVLTVARGWRRWVRRGRGLRIAAGKAGAVGVVILVVPHNGESSMGRTVFQLSWAKLTGDQVICPETRLLSGAMRQKLVSRYASCFGACRHSPPKCRRVGSKGNRGGAERYEAVDT